MIKIKDQTIKALDDLQPDELLRVYDMIINLKGTKQTEKVKSCALDYIKVREALSQCKGSLSEDIILERGDRV